MDTKYFINKSNGQFMKIAGTTIGKDWTEMSKAAFDNLLATRDTLQEMSHALIHVEGNVKGNKAKTDVLKHNPDVVEKFNAARQLLWKLGR